MIPYGGIFDGLPWVPQVLFTFHHSLFLLLILNSWIVLSLGSLILSSGYSDLLLNLSGESLHFSYWTSQFQNSFPSFNRILRMVRGSQKSWVEITEKSHILLIPTQAQPPSLPASCTKVAHRYIHQHIVFTQTPVYIRVHSWCCWQMYNDLHPPWQYHAEESHGSVQSPLLQLSLSLPSTPDNRWFVFCFQDAIRLNHSV